LDALTLWRWLRHSERFEICSPMQLIAQHFSHGTRGNDERSSVRSVASPEHKTGESGELDITRRRARCESF
jgi:hypothetical protein